MAEGSQICAGHRVQRRYPVLGIIRTKKREAEEQPVRDVSKI